MYFTCHWSLFQVTIIITVLQRRNLKLREWIDQSLTTRRQNQVHRVGLHWLVSAHLPVFHAVMATECLCDCGTERVRWSLMSSHLSCAHRSRALTWVGRALAAETGHGRGARVNAKLPCRDPRNGQSWMQGWRQQRNVGKGRRTDSKWLGREEPLGLRQKNLNEQHLQNRRFRETARGETLRPGRAAAEPTRDLEEGGQRVSGGRGGMRSCQWPHQTPDKPS